MARWIVQRDGKNTKPMTEAEIMRLADQKRLRPEDKVSPEGKEDWKAARTLVWLFPPQETLPDAVEEVERPSTKKPREQVPFGTLLGFILFVLGAVGATMYYHAETVIHGTVSFDLMHRRETGIIYMGLVAAVGMTLLILNRRNTP